MIRFFSALAALAAYAVLALLYLSPLAPKWNTHAIGFEADASTWLWHLWHLRHSLVDLGVNPLWTDFQYWPCCANLLLSHFGLPYGLLGIALHKAMNLTSTYNALMLGNIAFGGFFAFLMVRASGARLSRSREGRKRARRDPRSHTGRPGRCSAARARQSALGACLRREGARGLRAHRRTDQ